MSLLMGEDPSPTSKTDGEEDPGPVPPSTAPLPRTPLLKGPARPGNPRAAGSSGGLKPGGAWVSLEQGHHLAPTDELSWRLELRTGLMRDHGLGMRGGG